MILRQFLTALALALALVALAVTGALAHAGLISTDPADGAVLPAEPSSFSLTYTEPVSPTAFSVVGVEGVPLPLTGWSLEGPTVHVPMPAGLKSGSYLFSWRVISEDGHPVNGTIGFAIGAPSGTIIATAADPVLGFAIWATRALQYVALFLGVGSIAFGLLAPLPEPVRRIAQGLAAMGLLLVPVAIGLQGADTLGLVLGGSLTAPAWAAALASTYALTQGLFALAFILALVPGRWAAALAALSGGVAPALSGHASTAPPEALMRAVVFVHIASVMFWVGALLPLGVILKQGGADALQRFSRLIPYPIAALLLTGLTLAIVQMGLDSRVWPSAYGAILLAKLLLVGSLLLLGLWNRVRLTDTATAGNATLLRRSILLEIGLAVLVFGIVAGWRFTTPPRVADEIAAANAPASATLAGNGKLHAGITATPGRAGQVSLAITLPLEARAVTVELANPQQGVATISKDATPAGSRRWRVDGLLLPVGGTWTVEVDARTGDFDMTTLDGTLILQSTSESMPMNMSSMAAAVVASSMAMSAPAAASPGLLQGCATGRSFSHGDITVSGAYTRATPPAAPTAGGYLVIHNTGNAADTLTGADTPAASSVSVHAMTMKGQVMEMSDLPNGLDIPAGGSVSLDPMGYHLMLQGMVQPFKQGECVPVTLHFAKAGDIPVELNVGSYGQSAPPTDTRGASSLPMDMSMSGMDMSGMSSMSGM